MFTLFLIIALVFLLTDFIRETLINYRNIHPKYNCLSITIDIITEIN